jgi:hypothetical protein
MDVNFEIIDNQFLKSDSVLIDLHNNFDLINLNYQVKEVTLVLRWIKSNGAWVPSNEFSYIELIHSKVNYLMVHPSEPNASLEDKTCISELGYFPSSQRNINDCFNMNTLPEDGDDIIYAFESGQIIRINCFSINLFTG